MKWVRINEIWYYTRRCAAGIKARPRRATGIGPDDALNAGFTLSAVQNKWITGLAGTWRIRVPGGLKEWNGHYLQSR